ncbi:hypothetical protein HHL11_10230 [Ramlibacter sp. G-1-2-2]|uniref:Ig-like domain-containing protein n=1 Tax=Ramlibacter agri TaxID=2728837 RepID=A0A848H0Y6_9BURK|nr:hypothetical protein [Ramlibacter agri]NML44127.1 hypothetical protein [Ramlibacter agri]
MLIAANLRRLLACACVAGLLTACGGGTTKATIGGTVSGLTSGTSVSLRNSDGDTLTISANQSFTFPTEVAAGDTYTVTVLTQPVGQTCTVGNGTGTIDSTGSDVSNVTIACTATSSVGGTLSGLASGNSVWLATNGSTLALAANGAFAFPGLLSAGTAYSVTVVQQPAQQTCSVTNPSGTVVSGSMASVTVTCQ